MRKNLFYVLFVLSLASAKALPGNTAIFPQLNNQNIQIVNQQNNLPQAVKEFLATPVGKNFTAEQVLAAYNNAYHIMKVESGNVVSETKIDEDFSKLTAGSEDAPDATNIADNFDDFTKQSGWGGISYISGRWKGISWI